VQAALPTIGGLHAGVMISLLLAVAMWWFLQRTTGGLRIRATGGNAHAARFAGINVDAQIVKAMAISGALAGVAGSIELLGTTGRLFERFAAGYGYSGIAVALLAQLHPLATILSAAFFGALTTGAGELQRSADISSTAATFGQAVVILVLVAIAAIEEKRWLR
jgi:simple sugar transport system permease protein